jgi:YidC/Oxa1 family membrane protein insertase
MSFRTIFILTLAAFGIFCGALVLRSGVLPTLCCADEPAAHDAGTFGPRPGCILLQQTTDVDSPMPTAPTPAAAPAAAAAPQYFAEGGPGKSIPVGSLEEQDGFLYRLVLHTRGASIRTATFAKYDNRDHKDPQPLVFLSPVDLGDGSEVLSLANKELVLGEQGVPIPLDRLNWLSQGLQTAADGTQSVAFEATIVDEADEGVLKLTKTYRVRPETYLLECAIELENLADGEQQVRYNLGGPTGLGREAFRSDMRKVMAAFRNDQEQVVSRRFAKKELSKPEYAGRRELELKRGGGQFLWAATINKYFAAILIPVADGNDVPVNWIWRKTGVLYNPDNDDKANSGDEAVGLTLSTATASLMPAGQQGSTRTYNYELYLGPKDKSLFDKNARYKDLGFVQTIDFLSCCCPASIIYPLAFGILAIMKWMFGFIHNYGVVIIILVFLMRLIMHPVTKKSQISMSKMSKMAPKAEEIKKKYANNKAEMNKRLMELYREQGASPITGMLPMFVQMPIWIALWSAVYTSIDLRGAAFLPFWITDLSVPDALIRWPAVTVPLLGWQIESLNLLPILMGVAFYLQQKLMPTQQSAATNPQMAQQQKMMQIMLPLMFPLMLYKAPSGVNLYIMSSTFAGVIEQHVIRKHIREKEQQEAKGMVAVTSKTGGKVKKKKPKPFFKT